MYELLMQNMRGTEQVGRGDNQPAIDAMIVPSRAGRASLWARSRPCVVVGAEPAMRRPAGLLDLRRRCPPLAEAFEAFEACFGVLPALSSSSPGVDVAPGGAPPPLRLRGRASRGRLLGGRRQPRAGRRRGVRGLCCSVARPSSIKLASTCGGVGRGVLPPRRLRGQRLTGWPRWRGSCTRSWPWGSPTLDASKTRMI